jgi:serine/threonine-protein kinase
LSAAYYNRALAKFFLGDHPGALADLTHLVEEGPSTLRVFFLRSKVRENMGDLEGARQDREEGLSREPESEIDWIARGVARRVRDPQGALADYDRALLLNPHSLSGLRNKANVLAERLGRVEEAIAALDKILALDPDDVPARASRGVLRARLGRRAAAHADARESLRRDSQPGVLYQVAGIYALTSREEPGDRREAFRLLSAALRRGAGLELLDKDSDLDPLRDQPEFHRLEEAARTLHRGGGPKPEKP